MADTAAAAAPMEVDSAGAGAVAASDAIKRFEVKKVSTRLLSYRGQPAHPFPDTLGIAAVECSSSLGLG